MRCSSLIQRVLLSLAATTSPLLVAANSSYAETASEPAAVHFDIGPAESTTLFAAAKRRWQKAFDPKAIKPILKGLASGEVKMSEDLKKHLYVARKSGSILRASFQLLDDGHQKPKALDRYVRAAGKLNDAINAGQTEKIPSLAQDALNAMKVSKMRAEVKGFRPTSKESFNGYLYTSMLFAERASAKSTVNALVFHQLRKEMTNLLVLFEPGKKLSRPMQALQNRLNKLRFDMGDVHDDLVAKKTGRPADYAAKKVDLSKVTRKDVQSVLRTIRVVPPSSPELHYKRWKSNIKPGRGRSKASPKRARQAR